MATTIVPGLLSSKNRNNLSENLPTSRNHHLIVTTARGVYAWNSRGTVELFSSTSNGIVTARKMQTNKDLLAVADSQVVVVHDVDRGMQRTYRLKNEKHGQVRKLFYHPEKERLFFTTTLQNAVQSFSLHNSELLDAAPVHPSPPTTFAVSPACDLLVSASADPPTIYLSRIAYKQPPLLFVPNCSRTPAIAIAFHPTRSSVFALGFQDGTIAAYNATILPVSPAAEERYSYARIHGEISHSSHVHELSAGSLDATKEGNPSLDPTITAIQFLADQSCSVVSIGSDGRCCIVDFEQNGSKQSQVAQHWYLEAPATSLAILKSGNDLDAIQFDGPGDGKEITGTNMVLFAIGKSDGTVGIYNKTGDLLAVRDFSKDGRILDLEWMERTKDRQRCQPGSEKDRSDKSEAVSPIPTRSARVPEFSRSISPQTPLRSTRSSVGSKIMVKVHAKDPIPEDYLLQSHRSFDDIQEEVNEKSSSGLDGNSPSTPVKRQVVMVEDKGRSQTVSANDGKNRNVDQASPQEPADLISRHQQLSNSGSRRSSYNTIGSRSSRMSHTRARLPAVPRRPVPRPGGKLALRRMESAKARRPSRSNVSPVPREIVNAVTAGQPQFKSPELTVPVRPRMFRNRSSRISPFTGPSRPYISPMTPNIPVRSTTTQPSDQQTQKAPIQYDRLSRANWDVESSTSASRSSFVTAPRPGPMTPTKSRLASPMPLNHGSVQQGKVNMTPGPEMVPLYVSDSGTSQASFLDWTPARVHRANYVPDKEKSRAASGLPGLPVDSKPLIVEDRAAVAGIRKEIDSDVSSASQLDWSNGTEPYRQRSTQINLVGQPTRDVTLDHVRGKNAPQSAVVPGTVSSAEVPAPLQVPKLRKQETVINLKEKGKGSTTQSDKSKDVIRVYNGLDAVQQPRMSDPGPNIEGKESLNSDLGSKLPSMSVSAPPVSTSPGTRKSSQFRSLFKMQQMRSGSTVGSQSTYTIEDVIRVECAAICSRMDVAFAEQKAWLQGYLSEQNWYAQRLEMENRQFRDELARLRK